MASLVFGQYMDKLRELYQAGTITLKDMKLYTNQYMSPPAPVGTRIANVDGVLMESTDGGNWSPISGDTMSRALSAIQGEISASMWRSASPRITIPESVTIKIPNPTFGKIEIRRSHACNLGSACTQHNPKPPVDLSFMATEWDLLPDAK